MMRHRLLPVMRVLLFPPSLGLSAQAPTPGKAVRIDSVFLPFGRAGFVRPAEPRK